MHWKRRKRLRAVPAFPVTCRHGYATLVAAPCYSHDSDRSVASVGVIASNETRVDDRPRIFSCASHTSHSLGGGFFCEFASRTTLCHPCTPRLEHGPKSVVRAGRDGNLANRLVTIMERHTLSCVPFPCRVHESAWTDAALF